MSRVFSYLDVMAMRIVPLRYSAPPICLYAFSSTGSQTVVLAPLEYKAGPTGLAVNRLGNGFNLQWKSYPGVICYTVYKLEDINNPLSPYVVVAQCIQDTTIPIPEVGCETYIVTGLTPDGESASSESFTVGPDCEAIVYWNKQQTGVAECAAGFAGAPRLFTVSANKFGASTQAKANEAALDYANAEAAKLLVCVPEVCTQNCDGPKGGGGYLAPVLGPLPDTACVGGEFFSVLDVTHGKAPVTLTMLGDVPIGLVLDLTEESFYGTPQVAGYYQWVITATDSSIPVPLTSYRIYEMLVDEILTDEQLPTAALGGEYEQKIEVDAASPPTKWVVTSGALPDGLTLDENTGVISGVPTVLGQVSTFTVDVTIT